MNLRSCSHEVDLLALVAIGQWPRQADAGLVDHVAGCPSCSDALVVALALNDLQDDAVAVPALPDARAVWQRAEWQARRDAVRRAARPVLAMQTVTALAVIVTLAGLVWWLATTAGVGAAWQTSATAAAEMFLAATGAPAAAVDWLTVELSSGAGWLLACAMALGLSAVGLAVALSTLADRSEA